MASTTSSGTIVQPKRGIKRVLASYFYWTYDRGTLHYDIMVTLILAFIFVTPHLWDYGARPHLVSGPVYPLEVVADGRGIIVTVPASGVTIPAGASDMQVKQVLRKAIEPVTGDAVFVERWQTLTDTQGNLAWKVWAHR